MMRLGLKRAAGVPRTCAALSVAALTVLGFISACGQTGGDDSTTNRVQESDSAPWSVMYQSSQAACQALMEDPPAGAVLSSSLDAHDLAQIKDLMGGTSDIRSVADGQCGDAAVITVGVASARVRVPPVAANGTPIIVMYQPPMKAL